MADYGTTTGVAAYTRHLLEGYDQFNASTHPTATEVSGFLDEASACLNVALAAMGFTTPITTPSTAVTLLDGWAERQAVMYVKATQISPGYEAEGDDPWGSLQEKAEAYAELVALGLKRIGVAVGNAKSEGLTYTGLATHTNRTDPDLTAREQPKFRRGKFDTP